MSTLDHLTGGRVGWNIVTGYLDSAARGMGSSRVDYDAIAELYDSTPHREKSADPELIAFLAGCGPAASLTLLDIACGTATSRLPTEP
jgi:hypothetical protein